MLNTLTLCNDQLSRQDLHPDKTKSISKKEETQNLHLKFQTSTGPSRFILQIYIVKP
jgi:hypothetical protein